MCSHRRQAQCPLVVMAGDMEQEAIALLTHNRAKNGIQSCAVRLPMFGDRRRETLRDIAQLCEGMAFTEDIGIKLESVGFEHLAKCNKVVMDSQRTILIGGAGGHMKCGRVAEIKARMETATAKDKPYLQARLAGLTGGVAVIKVGGVTETQVKERKDRVEDAMYATKAAVESGVLPGGGTALLRGSQVCFNLNASGDEAIGHQIVRLACQSPCHQIAINAGLDAIDDWPPRPSP